jgi:beta-lactamase regulating signal transducer with metallopeptidase domain
MNGILWWLAQNTIAILFLIPIVAAVCRALHNRPAVQHVLWVVLLLKFISPPVVSWPWTVPQLWPSSRPAAIGRVELARVGIDAFSLDADSRNTSINLAGADSGAGSPDDKAAVRPRSAVGGEAIVSVSLWAIFAVWLLGMAGRAIKQCRHVARHTALLRRGAAPPLRLTEEIAAIARRIRLRPPAALVAVGIASPFIWSLGRLRLVWPQVMSSREAVVRARGVIAHELAHVRRGDHVVAWIELAAGLVHWWNPVFWYVRRRCRESAEMACDAIALGSCPDGRRTYAELLLELSTGAGRGEPVPVLGLSAGSRSSFERRLSMILSDRVSGKLSLAGLVTASVLALVALPGWTFAQKPASLAGEEAGQSGADSGATAARLEQIEAELKRLASLLEHTERPQVAKETPVISGAKPGSVTRWRTYAAIATTDPSAILFKTSTRNFVLSSNERTAYLSALDEGGRLNWHAQLPGPIPSDFACSACRLTESDDKKQVVISWIGKDKRTSHCFDAVAGKLLAENLRPEAPAGNERERSENAIRLEALVRGRSPGAQEDASRLATFYARLSGLGYFQNQGPPNPDLVKKVQRSINFGTGANRIYILSIENSAERPCFLSAQTNQAHQVWRSTFFNPLLTERWVKPWRESFSGPLPGSGLAGDWMVEESDDQTQVVVTWKGNRVLIRIRFDIATGKLQQEDFMPPALGLGGADAAEMDRGEVVGTHPQR